MRISRRGAWRASVVAPMLSIVLGSATAKAQDQMRVAVTGGVASDQRGVSSGALSVAPTLYFSSIAGAQLSLGGSFTRYHDQGVSGGVGVQFSAYNGIAGPFNFRFDATGNATRLSVAGSSASFFNLTAAPVVELVIGSMTFFGGGRAGAGRIAQSDSPRLVRTVGHDSTSGTVTRSGAGPSAGFTFLQSPAPGELLRLAGRGDAIVISGTRITDWSMSLTMTNSTGTFTGTLGTREAPDEHGPFGSASLSLPVAPSVSLIAAAGHYPSDRLTGAVAGNYGSIGFAFGSDRR